MPTTLWERLEDETVRLTGGHPTKASGRLQEKGDVQTATLLIECKHRLHKGPKYAAQVKQDWCDTVRQHADDAEKIPLLVCGLTWNREDAIHHRLTLCLTADLEHFQVREETGPYIWTPHGWTAITEDSVRDYCAREAEAVRAYGGAPPRRGRTMGGRPLSDNRPMNTGPSRWGR